ncbi:MAG: DeoR/GlpR family DNA-binding transcription regulator [Deltaproteobacteria bacterium]
MKEDFQLSGVRRKKIVDLVESLGSMAVKELCREFQVSEATIRRDLKELEEIGTVTRTHGGVMINSPSRFIDLPNEERKYVGLELKRRIGQKAISTLEGEEVVFLDAGTTALAVAEYANRKPKCRYVTTCLGIASKLKEQSIQNFSLIGGTYRNINDSFVGTLTLSTIKRLKFDISFLCCSAIDVERKAIFLRDEAYSQVQIEILESTRKNIVVAHHEKFEASGFISTASFDQLNTIIVNKEIDEIKRSSLIEHNLKVLVA